MAPLSVIYLCCAFAQGGAAEQVMRLEREWSAAYLARDPAAINRILAEDYVGTDGRGVLSYISAARWTMPKHFLPGVPNRRYQTVNETLFDMKVRLYGNNGHSHQPEHGSREAERKDNRLSEASGGWQCVSFHASRILK